MFFLSFYLSHPARGELLPDEINTVEVFKRNKLSVVSIADTPFGEDGELLDQYGSAASGFVWDKEGHIITNYHVVDSANNLVVTFYGDDRQYGAEVVGAAPKRDIAVIKLVVPPEELFPVKLGSSKDLEVGQKALAIGNPLGYEHTITRGIISALGREMEGTDGVKIHNTIQTDSSINPGNSGGPLLNSQGRVIGMNTAIVSASGGSLGIGFAIPVDTIKELVPILIADGKIKRPSIGILLLGGQTDEYIKNFYRIENGVIIESVVAGGPAENAGLRGVNRGEEGSAYSLGDIILEIAGEEVNSYSDIFHAIEGKNPGDIVSIRYLRDGEIEEVLIELRILNP